MGSDDPTMCLSQECIYIYIYIFFFFFIYIWIEEPYTHCLSVLLSFCCISTFPALCS